MAIQSAAAFAALAATFRPTDTNALTPLFEQCWTAAFAAGRRDAQHELIKIASDTDTRCRRLIRTAGKEYRGY